MIAKKYSKKILAIIVTIIFLPNFSYADDYVVLESSRCGRYFSLYEKTYHMPHNLLKAISITESGKWHRPMNASVPWPWTINVQGKGYQYNSKREAISAVRKFQSMGAKSIDVGCMQVNLKYHPDAFNNLEQAFEPKYNIGYAAKFLRNHFTKTKRWTQAVGRYHSFETARGMRYISKVYENWDSKQKGFEVASLNDKKTYAPATIVLQRKPEQSPDVRSITEAVLENF